MNFYTGTMKSYFVMKLIMELNIEISASVSVSV